MKLAILNRNFYGMPLVGEKKKKFFEFLSLQTANKLHFEEAGKCICGQPNGQKIASCDRFGFPVGSYLCQACGLIHLSPRLTEDSLPLFYDQLYWGLVVGKNSELSDDTLTTGGEGYGADVAAFVEKFFFGKQKIKIAEIGLGNGQKLMSLKEHFDSKNIQTELYGCDFSSEAVNVCKQKGIKAFQGYFDTLAPYGPFDLVIMSHVVEHLNDPVLVLKNVSKILGDSGYLYVEVPGVGELD
ncbi:MAG: class I SAM-dependent methyltransferase, partial [Bdellovibrionota bacterium]